MPRVIAMHDVDDVEHWLASTKRDEIFKGVVENMMTFVHPTEPNKVGVSMNILDMDRFQAIQASAVGEDAMKHDGVRPETIVVMIEA